MRQEERVHTGTGRDPRDKGSDAGGSPQERQSWLVSPGGGGGRGGTAEQGRPRAPRCVPTQLASPSSPGFSPVPAGRERRSGAAAATLRHRPHRRADRASVDVTKAALM